MGSMIGPITLTVGSPYKVQLAQDTAYIELQNDSLYDIWVYFGEVEPTDITNANNTWHRVVRRQHNGVLPVEGYRGASAAERRNNTIGAFKGTVWLLAVNPGGLAVTGTVSGRSQVYLTPYAQGDSLPAHSSLSTQTDLTSQPRLIAIPPTHSTGMIREIMDFTAAGQTIMPSQTVVTPPSGAPTFDGTFVLVTYIYYLHLTLSAHGAGAPKWAQVYVRLSERDAGLALLSSVNLFVTELRLNQTNGTGEQLVFAPHFPAVAFLKPGVTTAAVDVDVFLDNSDVPANVRVYMNAGIDYDVRNGVGVPPIGGGSVGLFTTGGSASLF